MAERRAREITIQADQSAALIEEQLTYLTTQLDHVRARVTAIRSRLAHELQSNPTSPVAGTAPRSESDSRPVPAAEYVLSPPPDLTSLAPRDTAVAEDSLPETLRVLRAALESLNGQPQNEPSGHRN